MDNKDILITTISKTKYVHGYFVSLKNTAIDAQSAHELNIISSAIFSRALTVGALLSGNLKNSHDILSVVWNCTGPAQKISVEVDYNGNLRGYIGENNLDYIEGSKSDKGINSEPYIGFGEMVVSRRVFDNRAPYSSVSVIETGEIAEDFSLYLDQSLQIQSAVKLGLSIDKDNNIEAVGGLLLMAMPGAQKEELEEIDKAFEKVGSVTEILKTGTERIGEIFKELNLEIINTKEIKFNCKCNYETISNFINTLTDDQKEEYIVDGNIEVKCAFCGKKYIFE